MRWLFHILNNTAKFLKRFFRLKPLMGNPLMSYPAAGTRCISILPNAPTKSICASGRLAFRALAMATAGKICPPVPPPLIIILKLFSILCLFGLVWGIRESNGFAVYSPTRAESSLGFLPSLILHTERAYSANPLSGACA